MKLSGKKPDWAAQSPDLNPFKHLWDKLERRLWARSAPSLWCGGKPSKKNGGCRSSIPMYWGGLRGIRFSTVCYVLVSTHLYIAVSLLASSRTTKQAIKKKKRWHAVTKLTVPQMAPSSERSAQSTLPLQILSGVRHAEVSLAQGYLGGLHTADSQDSSSERSSQSMSPSHTQLFVIHLPAGIETYRQRDIWCSETFKTKN